MKFLTILSFVTLALAAPTAQDQPLEARSLEKRINWDIIKTIWTIGNNEYKLDSRELLATFETCLVESGCENLNYGDKDSLGVWQQRYSMGWCPAGPQQCRDVPYSTRRFMDVLVKCSAQHPSYSAGQIAQCTQVSERPDAYDQRRADAQNLLNQARSKFGGSSGGNSGGAVNVGTGSSGGSSGGSSSGSSGSSGSSSSGSCAKTYTVVKGDNCNKIASKFSTSFSNLRTLNSSINSGCTNLQVGQKVCVKKGTSSSSSGSTSSATSGSCKSYHTVKAGETCNKIRGGTSLSQFLKLNPSVNSGCTNLQVGKKYCVTA